MWGAALGVLLVGLACLAVLGIGAFMWLVFDQVNMHLIRRRQFKDWQHKQALAEVKTARERMNSIGEATSTAAVKVNPESINLPWDEPKPKKNPYTRRI